MTCEPVLTSFLSKKGYINKINKQLEHILAALLRSRNSFTHHNINYYLFSFQAKMSVEHLSSQSHKGKTKILNSILFGSCWFCFPVMRQQEKTGKEMCIGLKLLTYFWNSHSVSHYLSLLSILQDKLAKLATISDERISKLHTQALYFLPQ